jgi:hypothetical protein
VACGNDQKCNGSGACAAKTWCESQTVPSDVALADFQCLDFDNGTWPSAWTLAVAGGGIGQISTEQSMSPPNSFYSFGASATAGTLRWIRNDTPVTRVDVVVDVFRPRSKGSPGDAIGHNEMVCAGFGDTQACLDYRGLGGYGVAYTQGTTRVDCGNITDLDIGPAGSVGAWNHVELQIARSGQIYLLLNGVATACDSGGVAFPTSNLGMAAIGVTGKGQSTGGFYHFDNVVVSVRR